MRRRNDFEMVAIALTRMEFAFFQGIDLRKGFRGKIACGCGLEHKCDNVCCAGGVYKSVGREEIFSFFIHNVFKGAQSHGTVRFLHRPSIYDGLRARAS
jgi:hypothetical protein